MQKAMKILAYFMPIVALFVLPLLAVTPVQAGIYDAESEVVYKEFWVPHSESVFTSGIEYDVDTGKCVIHDFGPWYLEAWAPCDKEITFNFPHDLSNVTKVEVYFDLWRNHDGKAMSFRLNNGPWHASEVGYDWSRTPWLLEIPKSELIQGENTLTLRDQGAGAFHVHDIAFRLYEPGVAAPTGALLTVKGDGAALNATAGGVLMVDNDTLTFTAQTSEPASFVEFHGYYDGFDEDNDGATRDWHSRGRNNCYPGGGEHSTGYYCPDGDPGAGQYGTIDHVGTDATPDGSNNYSVTWNLKHVPNQSGVKFKIRIAKLDPSNSTTLLVREAAGGVSAPFTLKRTRAVHAYANPNFDDTVLHHVEPWLAPDWADRQLDLPLDPAHLSKTYLLGSFWNNPVIRINPDSTPSTPDLPCPPGTEPRQITAFGGDYWKTSIREIPPTWWKSGENTIRYVHNTCSLFEFVERPGPLVVAHFKGPMVDSAPPTIPAQNPRSNQNDVRVFSSIALEVADPIQGVDYTSLSMKVDGAPVTPVVTGFPNKYILTYNPPVNFPYDTTVNVTVDACDLGGACMATAAYSFHTELQDTTEPGPSDMVSDDFNACALDTDLWTFIDPKSDSALRATGTQIELDVAGGVSHDVYASVDAPHVMQSIKNTSFIMMAKFDSDTTPENPGNGLHTMQGVLVQQDDQNFIRFSFDHDGANAKVTITQLVDGAPSLVLLGTDEVTKGIAPQYMRIRRIGSDWYLDISADGFDWTLERKFQNNLTAAQIGFFAGNADTILNANAPAHTAIIDYFFNMDSPISPEDGIALFLKDIVADPLAGGIVSAEPVTPTLDNPGCGNPVRITATPNPGYKFSQWTSDQGSVSGEQPVMETSFMVDEIITGEFDLATYSLDVGVVNHGEGAGGVVDWSPVQDSYELNEQVAFTATTPIGWTFDGWSGALSGNELNKTLSITADTVVTATFQQNHYALTTAVTGQGNVAVDPTGPYVYNQSVTLTADADAGWVFKEWQGDVPAGSTDSTLVLTMDSDKTATAVFEEIPPNAHVLTVNINGNGSVAKNPDLTSYPDGSTVTLSATPDRGWVFMKWQGDASGSSNPVTLAMDENKTVTAVFVEAEGYRLYLPIIQGVE